MIPYSATAAARSWSSKNSNTCYRRTHHPQLARESSMQATVGRVLLSELHNVLIGFAISLPDA